MTSVSRTITAELRKWRRNGDAVEGFVYNDINDCWEDGEWAYFTNTEWFESANFYLVRVGGSVYKCSKDEESPS